MAATKVEVAGTSQTVIAEGVSGKKLRTALKIINYSSSGVVFLSDVSPATTDGWPLIPGQKEEWDYDGNSSRFFFRGNVYGISDGSTVDIRIWEFTESK
jgi:hypothetical protein